MNKDSCHHINLNYNMSLESMLFFYLYIDRIQVIEEYIFVKTINLRKELILTFQRFTQLLLYIILFVHISGCIWIWIGATNDDGWIKVKGYLLEKDGTTIYIASIYYIVTTLATVGYGDFTGSENNEMIFSIVLEL